MANSTPGRDASYYLNLNVEEAREVALARGLHLTTAELQALRTPENVRNSRADAAMWSLVPQSWRK